MMYVYAAVPAGTTAPSETGIDGSRVSVIEAGGLGLVVSDHAAPLVPTRRRLIEHHRVNMALANAGAVLPFRFGNVFAEPDQLLSSVAMRRAELSSKLQRLAGLVELTVRITSSGEASPIDSHDEPDETPGRRYLLAKRRELDEAGRRERQLKLAGDRVLAALAGLIEDHCSETRGRQLMLALLLRRQDISCARTRLEEIENVAEDGCAWTVSGPWAPSSFA